MAKRSLNGVLQHIRKVAAVHTNRELSDRELLERFVGAHDEGAFTVLIERHGPMVLGVCARVLPNFHDAEDACQATFLVLARKAASIRKKTSLGSWLHGVACRVAASSKRAHARRIAHEQGADARPAPDLAADVTWREVQAILDDELQRLPDRYRAPLILCYLECMTRDEAAKQLGLSPTTLHGRLERARELLRDCLTRRGLTLAAAMSAAALGESAAQAALSPVLVVASTKAALMLAEGRPLVDGIVANHALTLAQEVLKSMFVTKLKIATTAVLCAGLFVALIGGSLSSFSVAQVPSGAQNRNTTNPTQATESDAAFIQRISKDLRGTEPTPTEVHFFVNSKDPVRRQKLIDLFIQERQARKTSPLSMAITKDSLYIEQPLTHSSLQTWEIYTTKPQKKGIGSGGAVTMPAPLPKKADFIDDNVQIRARVSGHVTKVMCKPGADVKKGDILVHLESPPYQARLAAAQATIDQSKAALTLAQANTRGVQELSKKGVVSNAGVDQARAQEEQAKATLRLAEVNAELATIDLDATTVRAPIDGKIGLVLAREGALALADQTILVVIGPPQKVEAK